jgi:hypothetical protein
LWGNAAAAKIKIQKLVGIIGTSTVLILASSTGFFAYIRSRKKKIEVAYLGIYTNQLTSVI